MPKSQNFAFLAAASYFSALVSLFLLNYLMFTVYNIRGVELLKLTAILAIKNPVFFSLTLPWWGSMICYWRRKFTYIGIISVSLGLTYYLIILFKILMLKPFQLSSYLFILSWSAGAIGALLLPIVLQSHLQGWISQHTNKSLCFLINILSAITIASLIFSVRMP